MPYYVCALPNKKGTGIPQEFISDSPEEIESWARKADQPGWGVYDCHNPLKDGATARNKETVGLITNIYADVDPKDVVETMEEVDTIAREFLLPLQITDSGRGRHIGGYLKEPVDPADTEMVARVDAVRRKLSEIFCGDKQVLHHAALRRRPGTHNTKDGSWVECKIVANEGVAHDLTDYEEAVSMYDRPLVTSRGPEVATYLNLNDGEAHHKPPIDVEARLSAMRYQGPGDSGINNTWWDCMGSMLRHGVPLEEILRRLHAAAEANCKDDPNRENWLNDLAGMADRWLKHEPTFLMALSGQLYEKWCAATAAGQRTRLVWRRPHGLEVRIYQARPEPQTLNAAATTPDGNTVVTLTPPQRQAMPGAPFVLRAFTPFNPATLPPRQFLFGRHYQRRTVGGTVAPGGTGKSTLEMVEAVSMATARNLLDEQPGERVRVWYHNGEDNMDELNRRVAAICQHYGIPLEELAGWFFMTSGNEVPLRVAKGYSTLMIDTPLIKCITEAIGDHKIDVATFDPLVTLHGVPENDTGKMDTVIRIFAGIADSQDCAIELSHHTRKLLPGAVGDYGVDDMRGAGSLKDAMRAVRMLNFMAPKEAEDAGIGEYERTSYFRVDRVKANNAPPAKVATWRKFVNVDLPNLDEVGVIVPWAFPGADAPPTPEKVEAERRVKHIFMETLRRLFLAGRFVGERGAYNAPHVFAKEREARQAKISKAVLANAMRQLFDEGKIRLEEYSDANRHLRMRIVEV
jgi:hypothetical protein